MKRDAVRFTQLYKTVYIDLYRFALCMMKNTHDAEDVVSEAVLAAYENMNKLRKEDAFRSWIFTILANKCRKKLCQEERQKKLRQSAGNLLENIADREIDHGVSVDVRKAFSMLSGEEKEIVALSVFGGYSSTEIGKMMNLNPNTVRSKRSRAMEKMENILR